MPYVECPSVENLIFQIQRKFVLLAVFQCSNICRLQKDENG